jgi:hypothetical protein
VKQNKKIISFLLSLAFVFSLCIVPASAGYEVQYGDAAEALWEEGLFLGSGGSFDLDQPLTRTAGAVMIVRLLGKEAEAKAGRYTIPFTDVADWAKQYVGYCYTNGIVNGTGENIYGSNENMTAAQYLTLVLRALGYNDKAGDFSWDKAAAKALEIGMIDQEAYTRYTTTGQFLRDDAAGIAYAALSQRLKGTDRALMSAIILPGRPVGEMPVHRLADLAPKQETAKPSASPADSGSWLKASIGLKTASTTKKPDSWPKDAENISLFIGDGYAYTLSWSEGPDGSTCNPEATLHATSGIVNLYSYWEVTEPATVDLAIICDGEKIYTMKNFTVKAGDYVDINLAVDAAVLSANLGKGDHKVSIAVLKPVYADGKFLYEDNKAVQAYNIGTGEKGATFKLSKGLSGSATTSSYLYAGGQTYGVQYFFTLETGKYGGEYTMSFPAEDGTDNRTFTTEPNSIYHITYTYGIDYSATYSYNYKFSVNLTGPQSSALSYNDKHPGKMNTGNFQIEKQP